MPENTFSHPPRDFVPSLFTLMKEVEAGVRNLEFFEFEYMLEDMLTEIDWDGVAVHTQEEIERQISCRDFYTGIQVKPLQEKKIVLDDRIINLTRTLWKGMLSGSYPSDWVKAHFYFDIRGAYFLPRTVYFTGEVQSHFEGKPYLQFARTQSRFDRCQDIGYREFKRANAVVDQAFISTMEALVNHLGTPLLVTLAGPTAAGKTEITARLQQAFRKSGRKVSVLEVDHFLLDRELREGKPMGRESTHFDIFLNCLGEILKGHRVDIPRYDFVNATSSHDLNGKLRPGCLPLEIQPADIVFMEGNFPFHIPELAGLIGIKTVYLTDDPIRLKRKWKRDVDYRKKYDPTYFRNRYFKTQFLRAEEIYRPLMQECDLVVDTTGAALWATPRVVQLLNQQGAITR